MPPTSPPLLGVPGPPRPRVAVTVPSCYSPYHGIVSRIHHSRREFADYRKIEANSGITTVLDLRWCDQIAEHARAEDGAIMAFEATTRHWGVHHPESW